jgi:MFS family permease
VERDRGARDVACGIMASTRSMLQSPIRIIAGFPRPVRLLVAGTLVNRIGALIVPFLTLVLLRDFHLAETDAARLLLAFGAGSVVSLLAGGVLTDHLGRRRTLLASLFGSGLLAVAMGLAPSVGLFVPLLVVFGFVADLYRPASSAVIGDLLPSSQRASGFAALRMVTNVGWAVGMTLGGLLADWSWRLLFVGDGLTTLVFGAVVLVGVPETRSTPEPVAVATAPAATPPRAFVAPGPVNPVRDGVYLQAVFAGFVLTFMFCSQLNILPLTITGDAGYPSVVFGALVGTNGVLIALLEISIVERLRPLRRLRLAALGHALVGTGFGMMGLVMHWAWFLLAVLVFTAGEILSSPQLMAFVADWAPPEARGRYLSLYHATWSVAFAVSPAVLLPLRAFLGGRAVWGLMPVLALAGTAVLLHLDRKADRPERLRGAFVAPVSG